MQLLWQPCWKWTCICIGIGGKWFKEGENDAENVFLCAQTVSTGYVGSWRSVQGEEAAQDCTDWTRGGGGTSTATHSILKTVC